jgi:hypothetical protein
MAEFDDFADELARSKENQEQLKNGTNPEWAALLGFVGALAQDGKGIEDRKFEWVSDAWEPHLVLDCVAATFLSRQRSGVQTFRVYFNRRPSGVGKIWSEDDSPLTPLMWTLQPAIEDDTIKWFVTEGFEDGKRFSSFEMSQKVGIELAKFHLAYKRHYENWSPA